jgi:hypothetical protein
MEMVPIVKKQMKGGQEKWLLTTKNGRPFATPSRVSNAV